MKKCEPTYKDFQYKDCQEENYSVKHKKKLPKCREVTKDNCVTDWDIDENGNKVKEIGDSLNIVYLMFLIFFPGLGRQGRLQPRDLGGVHSRRYGGGLSRREDPVRHGRNHQMG